MKETKKYIRVNNDLVEVSSEIYTVFYQMKRHEKYLLEAEVKQGVMLYSNLDTDNYSGENLIIDKSQNIEKEVIDKIMYSKLREALKALDSDELKIIKGIFFSNKSERQLSKDMGIPQRTINYKKQKVLSKLKSLLEDNDVI